MAYTVHAVSPLIVAPAGRSNCYHCPAPVALCAPGTQNNSTAAPVGVIHQMQAQPIHTAARASDIAPLGWATVPAGPPNADGGAPGDWNAGNDVHCFAVERLPMLGKDRKHGQKQVLHALPPTGEATGTHHPPHVAIFVQEGTRARIVAAEK